MDLPQLKGNRGAGLSVEAVVQDRRTKEVMGNPGGLGSFLCSHWPTSKAGL